VADRPGLGHTPGVTTAPGPAPTLLSLAARQLSALGDPRRLALLAAVLRLAQDPGGPPTLAAVAAAQEDDPRSVARQVAALASAGLVRMDGHRVVPAVGALAETSTRLLSAVPVVALLAEEPDLARFFDHGRLPRVPLLNRVEERGRLAALLVRLLPAGRSMTEPEVGAVLREVMDDVPALRRFLVEEGRLTRDGAQDYRRVDP